MKVIVNRCYGGFSLSTAAVLRYAELKGITLYVDEHIDCYYKIPVAEFMKFREEADKTRDYSKINNLHFSDNDISRQDPVLIQVIEELGSDANGQFSKLEIIEIPDDVNWEIDDYDGMETIAEVHRRW